MFKFITFTAICAKQQHKCTKALEYQGFSCKSVNLCEFAPPEKKALQAKLDKALVTRIYDVKDNIDDSEKKILKDMVGQIEKNWGKSK